MHRSVSRAASVLLASSLAFSALPASAQDRERSARDDVREDFDIDDQGHRAALLYGLGFTTFGLALTGFIGSSIAAADGEGQLVDSRVPDGPRRTFWHGSTEGMFIVFGISAAAGIGMVIAALVLDLDAHRRRDDVRERREQRLAFDWSLGLTPQSAAASFQLRF